MDDFNTKKDETMNNVEIGWKKSKLIDFAYWLVYNVIAS